MSIIDIAKKEIGYKEGTNNDTKYGIWFGLNHQPWCMMFIVWCYAQAGLSSKILKTAGCQAFEAWAIKNKYTVPVAKIQAGDLLLFDFDKAGKAEHIEVATGAMDAKTHLIPTIGGNTGPDHVGVNQANGDGVYNKVRTTTVVRTVVRIPS
jgi:hypothetical protein